MEFIYLHHRLLKRFCPSLKGKFQPRLSDRFSLPEYVRTFLYLVAGFHWEINEYFPSELTKKPVSLSGEQAHIQVEINLAGNFGTIIAIVQYPILRREIRHVWSWILANVIGWTLGFYLSQLALNLFSNAPAISPLTSTSVTSAVTGVVAGAITGIALIWIVRQPDLITRQ